MDVSQGSPLFPIPCLPRPFAARTHWIEKDCSSLDDIVVCAFPNGKVGRQKDPYQQPYATKSGSQAVGHAELRARAN